MTQSQSKRILTANDVIYMTGLSRSSLSRLESLGEFPGRIHVGLRSIGWLESEINKWIKNRPKVNKKGVNK